MPSQKFRRCKVHYVQRCLSRIQLTLFPQYFESDGTPIDYGCPRPAITCNFAHPSDPDWDRLQVPDSAGLKRWKEEQHSPTSSRRTSSFHRDRDRERRRSPSPPPHRAREREGGRRDSVASASHSDTRSLSHDTRGTTAMNVDRPLFLGSGESEQDIKPIISKSGFVMDSHSEIQRPVLRPIVTTAPTNPEHSSSSTTTVHSATYVPNTPSSVRPSLSSNIPTAMPPPDDPPVPPPPPLPVFPELNTMVDSPVPLDAESQAKVDVWETRIK